MIPDLTPEQRQEAHKRSLELRQARADIKRMLSGMSGSRSVAVQVIWEGWPASQGMKVIDLLTALPGIGTRRALALLQQAGIPSRNTVRACGPRQTERLFGLLER